MKTTTLKFSTAVLQKENMKRAGIALVALIAFISIVAISIGGDEMPAKQQSAGSDKKQSNSPSTASNNKQKIKPVTKFKKSGFKARIGPPTKRLVRR